MTSYAISEYKQHSITVGELSVCETMEATVMTEQQILTVSIVLCI